MSRIEDDFSLIREIIFRFYKTRRESQVSSIVSKYAMDYEDIFQIACIAYLRAETKYNPNSGFKRSTFICHCIKRDLCKISQHHGQKKRNVARKNFLSLDARTNEGSLISDVIPCEESAFKRVDNKTTVKRLLNELDKRERRFVIASFYHEKPHVLIAKENNIHVKTASKWISNAIIKMRAVATR